LQLQHKTACVASFPGKVKGTETCNQPLARPLVSITPSLDRKGLDPDKHLPAEGHGGREE
jgi:hypothetical protein